MGIEDILYNLGELVYSAGEKVRDFILPRPSERTPSFNFLRKLVKRDLTPHEYLSLKLQLLLLGYLALNLIVLLLRASLLWLVLFGIGYFMEVRYIFQKYASFFLDVAPYKVFYYGIGALSFVAFVGYAIFRQFTTVVAYYYGYLIVVFVGVLIFRWYFKQRFGRDYTYGIVEEVKNDLVRVFVHDDIAANVKPGYYWVERVQDAEPGRVVKLLLEDRKLRGAVPSRILEVYLEDQSSQTSSEPKNESE